MAGMKPPTRDGYPPELAVEARRMCLYVATILGDLLDDIVVVGGLVPYLLVPQDELDVDHRHVGTRDLDLGLSLAVLDAERYQQISARLRAQGFSQSTNESGNPTRQTWRLKEERIQIDFLIPPVRENQRPSSLQNLERDFAAIVTPALPVAFLDQLDVSIDDVTPPGEKATRVVRVCGPAAFVVLKAHAVRKRGDNKDAYDLVYMLEQYGDRPVEPVVARFALIAQHPQAAEALRLLAEDFDGPDSVGPMRRGAFLRNDDVNLRQDAVGLVEAFLRGVVRS